MRVNNKMPKAYITISKKESNKACDLINLIDKLKDVKEIKNLQNIIDEIDNNELIDIYRKRCEMPIRGVSNKPKVICNLCNCKVRNGGLWEHKQTKKCKRMIALNELKDIKRKTAKIDADECYEIKFYKPKEKNEKQGWNDIYFKIEDLCDKIHYVYYNTSSAFAMELSNINFEEEDE